MSRSRGIVSDRSLAGGLAMALGLPGGLAVALGLLAGTAAAQNRPCLPSVGYNTALQARTSHARTYSAMATLEQELLPGAVPRNGRSADEENAAFYVGFQSLFAASRVPACGGQILPYDVHAYRIGFGSRWGQIGFFYSAAANMGLLSTGPADSVTGMMVNYLIGHAYATVAPLAGEQGLEVDDLSAMSLDYVAMLTLDLDLAEIGVGYVGSTGLYVTALNNRIGAFLRGLVELGEDVKGGLLSYLAAGLEGFSPVDRPTLVGVSDLWVRKRQWSLPTEAAREALADFWMVRGGQRALFGLLDLHASYSWAPESLWRDLTATLHTGGYHPDLLRRGLDSARDLGLAAGLSLGRVNLPGLPAAGVAGGGVTAFALDGVYTWASSDGASLGHFRMSLRRNHADTLELFPYAQDAWDLNIEVRLSL